MSSSEFTVFVVDDEPAVRDSLSQLLMAAGWPVLAYASGGAFLAAIPGSTPGCVLLDVSMPDMNGPQLHEELREREISLPVIYLTATCSVSVSVRAMKQGALDFLEKPVDIAELLPAISAAKDTYVRANAERVRLDEIRRRISLISPRELEVMKHVIAGRLNKQIAADLGIVEKTVKIHRARVMEKMGVRSVAQLVQLCGLVGVQAPG